MFENIRNHINLVEDLNEFRINKTNLYNNRDGLIWEDKNELTFNGKLFDIVEIINDKDDDEYLIVYALNDKQEETLLKSFSNIINELVTEHTSNANLRTILFNLISQALPKIDFSLIPVKRSYIVPASITLIPKSLTTDPLSPPPKFV
jgi:hypothetical protein